MQAKLPIDKLIEKFLKSKLCFSLVPLGSSSTLPVPMELNGKVCLSLLFYTGKKIENKSKISIYRPHTKIILNYSIARIVNYIDLSMLYNAQAEKWKEPIGEFPHKEIETLSLNEYKNKKRELMAKFENAIKMFNGNTLDANFKNDFRQRFNQLCEPSLRPFMNEVGPRFFKWLNEG